jgi:Patatin-like phospholipase
MPDNKKTPPDASNLENIPIADFEWRSREVHKIELEHYLKKRRQANGITEEATPDNLSGLCISGGGVRSSTLGLGMLQAFIKANKLKYFDYLSTVSGGGFIGACLSSLMSAEPERRDKPWNNQEGKPILNKNKKFDASKVGLEQHNSLFTGEQYEYPNIEDGSLSTKHQLIHLRQHGEYLTPHKSIKDWDVHRLIGALFGGIVANISTFLLLLATLVLLHHVLLSQMSGDKFIDTIQKPTNRINGYLLQRQQQTIDQYALNPKKDRREAPKIDSSSLYKPFGDLYYSPKWATMSTTAQLKAWADLSFAPQLALVWIGVQDHWQMPLKFAGTGFLFAALFIFFSRKIPYKVVAQEQAEQNYTGKPGDIPPHNRKSDEAVLDKMERRIIWWFYNIGFWGAPAAAYAETYYMNQVTDGAFNYFVMLALPLCYSLGLFLGLHILIFLYFINHGKETVSGWLYRSFYTGMQGGAFLMVLITLLFPIAIIMLFGGHGIAVTLSFSFVPVVVAYYFTVQSLGGKAGGGMLTKIVNRLQMPLLNLSIFLFVGLTFAWISKGLIWLENYLFTDFAPYFDFCEGWSRSFVVIVLFFIFLLFLLIMGMLVNANDVSLHYFYRDRLSEAFLRTSGRVSVKKPGVTDPDDFKLMRINLRNHEDLQLRHLGEGNFKGPYHLIVAALNLQGSHDLSAKTLKSEHFLFSKYYIGSRSTGYVRTAAYKDGDTKLSTAMAISGAAVSSGMGSMSFAASNFYMTLFNLRTGYWIDNPRHIIGLKQMEARKIEAQKKLSEMPKQPDSEASIQWTHWDTLKLRLKQWLFKFPFWLHYIWCELTGNLGSNTLKINVSDGGHTGDNLGLLPLIQRRCSTIVVADFEADGSYSFASFAQAVRLAKSIYNVDITIDLTKLMPRKLDDGEVFSPCSVIEGVVTYNSAVEVVDQDGKKTIQFSKKTGKIIYMKSSVSLLREAAEQADENAAPPPVTEPAPVMVLNYFKRHPQFPHQTTADQYFDEVQFEAYRMLGEHIGKQAARNLTFTALQ